MVFRYSLMTVFTILLFAAAAAVAGNYHHGHSYLMPTWNMEEMDADKDGALTFDEYAENHRKQLRNGFDVIDTNDNGVVETEEWNDFLRVHGMQSS